MLLLRYRHGYIFRIELNGGLYYVTSRGVDLRGIYFRTMIGAIALIFL